MRVQVLIIMFMASAMTTWTQPLPNRYVEQVFPGYTETSEVLFSTGVPEPNPGGGFYEFITGYPLNVNEWDTDPVNLYMDIFEPTGDTLAKRPAIIICFGGGFLSGSKDHWSIRLLAQELAKRGFVTATIDYRLGMNVFDADLATRAVYRGLQDGRSAVRFFRADAAGANLYRVDPDQIYIGGHSSGGFIGLHNVYLEHEYERPLSTYAWTQDAIPIPDLGCLDCAGNNQAFSGHAQAVFNLAGGLGMTTFMESANDGPVVLFHSEDDDTVPYGAGTPFASIIWLVVGADLPDVWGSLPISVQAAVLGIPYQFYSYTDRGHAVHEDGSSALYSDIVPGISEWFDLQFLNPEAHPLQGDSIVCTYALNKVYSIAPGDAIYFDWQVEGGTFLLQSTAMPFAVVSWDTLAPSRSISVTPYNEFAARGETQTIDIDLVNYDVNQWLGGSGSWADPAKWSLGHVPLPCQDVVIFNGGAPIIVDIPDGTLARARALYDFGSVILNVGVGAELRLLID